MRCLFPSLRRFLPLARAQRAWLLALIVFSCGSFEWLSAQSLSISNLNTAAFPRISADIRAFDAAGNRITSAAGFTLQEDGVPRTLTVTSCPTVQPQTFSAVLTIDISGSMGQPRGQGSIQYFPIDIAKAAATAFIDALPANGTECALTAFETSSYIMSYFTQDRTYLKSAVDALYPLQGTNYQDAFLHPITGALAMAGRSTNQKRAIIFLTDGLSGANTNMVVAQAMMLNVQVYCITIGLPAPQVLRDIVNRTGGRLFDNVTSREAAIQIYRELANTLSIDVPCRVEWTSEPTCTVSERRVSLTHNQIPNITASDRYTPQFSLASLVSIMPRGVAMGAVPVRTAQTRVITFTLNSGAQPVQVQNIRSSDPAFTIDRRSLTFPFTLQPAQAQQISIIYTAPDSNYHFTTFNVEIGNGCKLEFYGTAGFPGARPTNPVEPLILIQPNGGEEFLVGTDTDIKWKGVPSDEPVKLEYSIDAGISWRLVDSLATGLSYKWRVPNTPSTQCLMRVTQKNTSFAAFSNDSLIVLYQNKSHPEWGTHNKSPRRSGAALSAQFDKTQTGNEVVTTGSDGKAFLWNGWTGEPSSRTFDLNIISENGDVIDATYNTAGELGIIFFGSTGNTNIVPSQFPGTGIRTFIPQGRAPLSAIRFNPLVPNQFVITPSDPIFPVSVYRFDNLGALPGQSLTKEFDIENSQGSIKIANFTSDGQWIYAAYDRQIKLWDIRQTGPFPVFTAITWEPEPQAIPVTVIYADAHLSASGLIIAVTCSDNTIRFLSPSRTQTDKLEQVNKFDAPTGMTIGKTTFNRTGQYLVSTAVVNSSRSIALVWDVNNPAQPFPLLNGPRHGARVNSAFFSNDEPVTRVVTTSEDGTAIIWFLREKLPLQRDESDRVWSIVRPVPQIFDVDMKRVVVGAAKDSVCVVLNNSTKYEIPIQQAFIASRPGQQTPFSLVSGNAPFSISTRGTARIEFRFTPTAVGTFIDTLVIITVSGDRLTSLIRGEGIAPSLTGINVDFGTAFVGGMPKDTTVTALITNIGQTTLTLTAPTIFGPRSVFQQGNGFPLFIELSPQQSARVPLRFAPQSVGTVVGTLRFTVPETGQITTATLIGTGIQEGALLQSIALEASPLSAVCDTTSFLVVLENKGNKDAIIPATGSSIRAISGGMVLNSTSSEFVILNPRTITIPAGSTTAIVVQFRPQRLGVAEARLIVTSNSLGGDISVSLKGTLERDSLVIPPNSRFLVLASVEPNTMKDTTIVVRNAGNAERIPWFDTPKSLGESNSRFTVGSVPLTIRLPQNASSTLRFTFTGGEAGKTYNDYYIFPRTLCNIGSINDTVRVSITVNSRPELRFLTPPVNIVTCASTGLVNVVVTNIGTAVASITNIGIRAPFSIDGQTQFVSLLPNSTATIAVRYNLTTSGIFTDSLRVSEVSTGTIALGFRVQRANVDFSISPRTIDFPRLEANTPAGMTVTITNNGSIPLDLAQALMRRTGDNRFSFSPTTPIPPNSTADITVRFSGGPGNQNFSAQFPFESVFATQGTVFCRSDVMLQVNASTIGRTGELALSNISGNVGEKATVYVYLRNRNNIPIGTVINDTVRTNVTMLFPEAPTPRGFHDYGERVIPVRWRVNSDNENVPIDSLKFLILAGNDSVATLRLMGTPQNRAPNTLITVAPIGPEVCRPIVTPFTVPGIPASAFCLLGLPYRTGNSFITTSLGTVSITNIIPQPVTAEMTLEFWSREATLYVLRITDALGQEIMSRQIQAKAGDNTVIVNETIGQKSGVYFIYLRNARELAARRFMITR